MIKAILFDLDGTLINTNELIIESFKYTFKKHLNRDVPRNEIIKIFGETLVDAMNRYDRKNVNLMISTYKKYNEGKHDQLATIFEGVEEGLKVLRDMGIKLAVVTSKYRKLAERGLKLIGVYDYIDVIVTSEDTDKHKPFGEPAEKACELLKVEPRETIMVGDSHNDVLCGRNAGCSTAIVKYSILPLDELMKYEPDYVIKDVSDLVSICNFFK